MKLPPLPFLTGYESETALLMASVAAACAVPGVFLVLRRLAMVSDAIGHVLLFGIVAAYLLVEDLDSPWLMIGAAASGVLTVALVELLQRSQRVNADAAVGLTFPVLFSLGVILASMYTRNTHLDVDQVLLGFAELATFDRVTLFRLNMPRGFAVVGGLFVMNSALVGIFYKELKLSTFDVALAGTLGFLPGVLHYGLMTMVSLTAVASFDAVGPVLVVAFFAVPPSAAYLLTDRLSRMLGLSVLIGVASAVAGVLIAFRLDTTIAGTTAAVLGLAFGVVFVAAPGRGLAAQLIRRWRQRREFHETMLAIHLLQHEGTPAEADEARVDGLHRHLLWTPAEVSRVVARAGRTGLVVPAGGLLKLTNRGRLRARVVLGA